MDRDFLNSIWLRTPPCHLGKGRLKVLLALTAYSEKYGYAPTVREVADLLGHKSHSTAHLHLEALRRSGFVRGQKGVARSWELTRKGRLAAGAA